MGQDFTPGDFCPSLFLPLSQQNPDFHKVDQKAYPRLCAVCVGSAEWALRLEWQGLLWVWLCHVAERASLVLCLFKGSCEHLDPGQVIIHITNARA